MPINGRPLLGLWLQMLAGVGIADIVLNLHHHADLVRNYVDRSPYRSSVTLSFESELLGTGGTLLHNRDKLSGGPVLFAHADNLTCFDMAAFLSAHRQRPAKSVLTMMTFKSDAPQQCGIVELDRDGLVVGFHEKVPNPPGDLANAAVYILEPEIFDFLGGLGKTTIDFSNDVLPHFLGRMTTFHNDIYHRDIGTLASLARAQLEFPFVDGSQAMSSDADPYFGLMQSDNGRLAQAFANAIDAAFRDVGPDVQAGRPT